MKCVPSTHNLFHAPCARAQHSRAVVLLLSNTCGLMMKFLLVSKLKRQLCSSIELEANQSNKLFPGFSSYISEDYLILRMLLCVNTGSKQRNAGPVSSQVAVNSRWKANSWICSVISGLRLPPDSWNVRDDKRRPRHPHPAQHAYQTHTLHTYSGMQRNEHVQEDNKPCLVLFLRIYLLKQQNTSYPNLPQITSNILPWIDSLYFNCKCYVLHIVLPQEGFHTRKRYIY